MGVMLTVDIGGSTQTCIKFVIFCALGMKTHIHAPPPNYTHQTENGDEMVGVSE